VTSRVMLYSAVDDEVTHFDVDVDAATLTRRSSLRAPSYVQEGWAHPSRQYLYLTTSNRGPGLKADMNHVSAYRIDGTTGALAAHGQPMPLPHRAVWARHLLSTPPWIVEAGGEKREHRHE